MEMPLDEAWNLIEKTALHAQRFSNTRSASQVVAKKGQGMYEVDSSVHKEAQNSALLHEIAMLKK